MTRRIKFVRAERVFDDVAFGDTASVRTPWWRRALSAILLTVLVGTLGLVLTALVCATGLLLFLLLDQLVG